MPEESDLLARASVPNVDGPITTPGGNILPIRSEGDGDHPGIMPDARNLPSRLRLPDACNTILRSGGDVAAVRAGCHTTDFLSMCPLCHLAAVVDLPDAGDGAPSGGNIATIGA